MSLGAHCTAGLGIWPWASNEQGGAPDVVMACCGDVLTLKTLAAIKLLRTHFFDLKVRVINVVNLMKLQPQTEHPHGLSDEEFDALVTTDKPIICADHGYPSLINRRIAARIITTGTFGVSRKRARRPPPST